MPVDLGRKWRGSLPVACAGVIISLVGLMRYSFIVSACIDLRWKHIDQYIPCGEPDTLSLVLMSAGGAVLLGSVLALSIMALTER